VKIQSCLFGLGLAAALMVAPRIGLAADQTAADQAAGDIGWPYYNGSLESDRFSGLKSLTAANVSDLKESCEAVLGDDGAFQSGPLVIGKTLFVTTTHTTVALDATDCKVRWRHVYTPHEDELFGVDRGAAYLDGRLFRGTSDGWLLALDAETGKEIWRVHAGNMKIGEWFSAAPIAWNGLVFIGPAGSDFGIQGRMNAYDAKTGKMVWRFNTVPNPDEPAAKTWHIPASMKHGGGGSWSSYTLDPATGELFVPVGNPAPDYLPDARPGDDLYTNGMVVLDAKTGALKWYYQLDPNDALDYDLGAAPILYTDAAGNRRVALGSKDGNLYILDRDTHKLVAKTAVTTVDAHPPKPNAAGVRACPGSLGGVEWNGPAYDPATGNLYVGAVDWCAVFTMAKEPWKAAKPYLNGSYISSPDEPKTGWIVAVDGATGKPAWRYHAQSPVLAGVTPTAGGIVLSGDAGGNFLAFDAKTGDLLKKLDVGGSMAGGVVTYAIDGKQYVALTAGNVSRVGFTTAKATPRLIVLTATPGAGAPAVVMAAPKDEGGLTRAGPGQGKALYLQYCGTCHGFHGDGGVAGPSLVDPKTRLDLDHFIQWVKNPAPPMPKLFPDPLNEQDFRAIFDYLQNGK
jgi:alcohol dehydrogenase (cytochrome c)